MVNIITDKSINHKRKNVYSYPEILAGISFLLAPRSIHAKVYRAYAW